MKNIIRANSSLEIEDLVEKVLNLKDQSGRLMTSKYSIESIVSILERQKITEIEKGFQEYDRKGVDIIDFVRIFLKVFNPSENETLYLVIALLDLFRVISEGNELKSHLRYIEVTNFISEIKETETLESKCLQTRKLPEPKIFNADPRKIREIDIVKQF